VISGRASRCWHGDPLLCHRRCPSRQPLGLRASIKSQVAGLTGAREEGWHARVTSWRADANWLRTASQTYHLLGVMEPIALAAIAVRRHMLRGTRRELGSCDIRNGYPAVQERRTVESQNDHAQRISSHAFLTLIQCRAAWSASHCPAPRLLASQARLQQSMA
jgi:hypothetical protein